MIQQSLRVVLSAWLVLAVSPSWAAQSVTLPGWTCAHPDTVYRGGFETGEAALPHDASGGSGGAFPGSRSRTLHIVGLGSGTQNYYVYLPADYTPLRSWPLLLALHGVAPYGGADGYAMTIRDDWANVAAAGHFIVAAPVADQVYNDGNNQPYAVSWMVPPTFGPNDYDLFAALRTDMESAYNIERTRIYGWGFSAGGHVMHDLGVNSYSAAFNARTMAAYSVSAGDLAGLACLGLSDSDCALMIGALPRKIPVDVHIGNSDPNFPYAQADHTLFLAQGWADGTTMFYNTFAGGHTYTVSDLQTAWANLCPNAVAP